MAIEQKALAERWELSKGRISQLVAEGMPLDSVEAAEKWRAERIGLNGNPAEGYTPSNETGQEAAQQAPQKQGVLETFESIVERQRLLVQLSRNQYIKAVREGSPAQSKLYASYDKTVNTLTKLKAELDRIAVMGRDFIPATEASEAMREMTGNFVNRLDKLALETAEACNPENPAKAVKALEAWARQVRSELSKDEQG
jgi:hypothetical protein